MEVKLIVPDYSNETGLKSEWEYGFSINVNTDEDGTINIVANKAGLVSLAKQLLTIAQDEVPSGCHMHYDAYNSLDEGSQELLIEKK